MPCFFHDWRDRGARGGELYQECARCGRRRVYRIGEGPMKQRTWADDDLVSDAQAVVRVVLTDAGQVAGIGLVTEGRLTPELAQQLAQQLAGWEAAPAARKPFLLFDLANMPVRLTFITVSQLTARG